MNRFVCVHGHFYQPPRENPWLEAIEQQDSALPYHDWNHRITAECYRPNAHARMLDDEGWIVNIDNNYAHMSFNMGPTILSWMQEHTPDLHQSILNADKKSAERFSGHGSAMAQVYNHMIMPLANARDKRTQVRWGIRDFESRFGRRPDGMWLSETAADNASLRVLAEEGIRFTVLAPRQCRRVRSLKEGDDGTWKDVGINVDTTRPYWVELGDGLRIAVFFYNGAISQSVAFERILDHGDAFAERLLTGIAGEPDHPTLVNIATDGESYGHHHRHGEMGLAYALHYIERNGLARLTNYAEFLSLCPPIDEAEIVQPSSWSCIHGVERWKSDCGCKADTGRGWNQSWRRPLRNALDWLRDELATVYETHSGFADPWAARDAYIDVMLDRSEDGLQRFLKAQSRPDLNDGALIEQLHLLEMQRHAMLMYTSCGWFFDELSGIETVQVIQYAGRAIQLALPYAPDIEHGFVRRLAEAKSNIPEEKDGAAIYARAVKPAIVDLAKVVAHYAVSSLFENYGATTAVYGFEVTRKDTLTRSSGRRTLSIGQVECRAVATRDSANLVYAVLHLGDHNLSGGVRAFQGQEEYERMRREVEETFASGDLAALLRLLDGYFLEMTYSLRSLFGDEQRRVLGKVLDRALEEATQMSLRMHNQHASLIRYVATTGVPLPATVRSAAEFILRANLKKALSDDVPDVRRVRSLVNEAKELRVALPADDLSPTVLNTMASVARRFRESPESVAGIDELEQVVELLEILPFEVDRFSLQEAVFRVAKSHRPGFVEVSVAGDADAAAWLDRFGAIAEHLRVRVG